MPKQTFLNLPREKQERIIEAAIKAFAEEGLQVDVATVVRKAGIARGSFYQYFEDMDDLFGLVLDAIADTKMAYLEETFGLIGKVPFLDFFRAMYERSLKMAEDHPEFVAIGSYLYASGFENSEYVVEATREGIRFFASLADDYKRKGLLRGDIDSEALAKLLVSISSDVAVQQLYTEHRSTRKIMSVVNSMIDIIEKGIGV